MNLEINDAIRTVTELAVTRLAFDKGVAYDVDEGTCRYRADSPDGGTSSCAVGQVLTDSTYRTALENLPISSDSFRAALRDATGYGVNDSMVEVLRLVQMQHDEAAESAYDKVNVAISRDDAEHFSGEEVQRIMATRKQEFSKLFVRNLRDNPLGKTISAHDEVYVNYDTMKLLDHLADVYEDAIRNQ